MESKLDDVDTSINEKITRKRYIDSLLKDRDWFSTYVKEEVNSVKSDFKNRHFILFDGNLEKGVDRFIDYLLLDENENPLAIIEAKRYSEDEEKGRIQARTYARDVQEQTGRKIPFFLTNGRRWLFVDEEGRERKVSGPFSQDDLKRRSELYQSRTDASNVEINTSIVNRGRSLQVVRKLSEHIAAGHRQALVQMATGTGKTRVAMALIDLLIRANIVRNVLFLADRDALVSQAKSSGFEQFFKEPAHDLRTGFDTSARMYVCTIQSMMGRNTKRLYERFSPGFFDLIVFDEAHRSIYDKNNQISNYFDAIKIGLTATPRESESKNTYEMFGCEDGKPTVEYSYDEALRDGVLVPYEARVIQTDVLSLGIKGEKLSGKLKTELRRQEVDPEATEFMGSEFARVFMDDKTNELIVTEFMAECYKSGEGKPCKSIFFCASQQHAKHMKKVFGKLYPNLDGDVQVITSKEYRAADEVKRFGKESEPRVALSVGMLDTGVDIPEVCNLVFVKPVFSSIRFWQMLGRGTRNFASCKHPEWLPDGDKKNFMIFDFAIGGHSNIKYHHLKVSPEAKVQKDVITKIFENRVSLLEKGLTQPQKELISRKVMEPIDALPESSFIVRERSGVIDMVKEHAFDLERYVRELRREIAPLMMLTPGQNVHVSSFILQVEKLFGYILERRADAIEEIRGYVQERVLNILSREGKLNEIRENKEKLAKVLQPGFWEDLTFDDVEFMVRELSLLMRFYEPMGGKLVQIDAPDVVLHREFYEKEMREDEELKAFLDSNPIARSIRDGAGVTSYELRALEQQLSAMRPELTVENVQKYRQKDFIVFLREVIGIESRENPRQLIEQSFEEYIIRNHYYTSRQLDFLLLLKKVFAERKYIDIRDLGMPPLSGEHPLEFFQMPELEAIVAQMGEIRVC